MERHPPWSLTKPNFSTNRTLHKVIKREQDTLELIKTEITEYLKLTHSTIREEHITKWKELSRKAQEEARQLGESLKQSRDAKLFRKRKRMESISNMTNTPPAKQTPHTQSTNLIEALSGLLERYSKNEVQQQQNQQSSKGKGPTNGRGFPRKGGPQGTL